MTGLIVFHHIEIYRAVSFIGKSVLDDLFNHFNLLDDMAGSARFNARVLNIEYGQLIIKAVGIEPPVKVSPRTGKEAYAFAKTDDGFKAMLESGDDTTRRLATGTGST